MNKTLKQATTPEKTELVRIEHILKVMRAMPRGIIEAGERLVNVGYRLVIRDVCNLNGIDTGDIVIVYLKTPNGVFEAGERLVNVNFRLLVKDVCEYNDIEIGDSVIVYLKKTNKKGKNRDK